jgi:hypothetical protein
MPEINKGHLYPTDVDVTISEIHDGIYRIAGFVESYGTQYLPKNPSGSFAGLRKLLMD